MSKFEILKGKVEEVLVLNGISKSKSEIVDNIHCLSGYGIKGDRHAGRRLSDVRDNAFKHFGLPKGIEVANVRQFSAVSVEELLQIISGMGIAINNLEIFYGCLAENLIISGIPNLTKLPANTKIFFTAPNGELRTAVLMVHGENMPCQIPGENIGREIGRLEISKNFSKSAIGKRGVVGTVHCTGKIKKGDIAFAYLP